jgi:cytochrome c1
MNKTLRSLAIALMLLLMTAITAVAGGWAVITLDELPGKIVAGQPFTIGFTVRQHGRTLRDDLVPIMRFDRSDAKESFSVTAKREGDSGHYVAEVTLPSAGQWNWKVDVGLLTQDMSPLTVTVPAVASTLTPMAASNPLPLAAGALGSLGALGAVALWWRTRARWALVVVAVTALVGVIGFATANTGIAQPVSAGENVSIAALDQAAIGRALFIDKGCVMCHAHPAVKTAYGPFWIGDEPPDLTSGKLSAEYLRQWLKDPAQLKPGTVMPNLHLSDAEIGALIAFLLAK